MYFIEYVSEHEIPKAIFVEKSIKNLMVGLLKLRYRIVAETFIRI